MTQEEKDNYFIKNSSRINTNIIILGKYVRCNDKVKIKCKNCGYEWEMTPHNLIKGQGCPRCSKHLTKNTEQFKQELLKINNQIEILSDYKNAQCKIKCKCKKCGNIWRAKPTHLLAGHGCPICIFSTGERKISSYLSYYNIDFISQYKIEGLLGVGGGQLRFDFYLPKYDIYIEYQGEQHFRPSGYMGGKQKFIYQKKNDKIKKLFIKNNNLKFLEITYKDNIEKKLNSYLECVTTAGY